ncbi:hypothetical protein, partial [Pseudomonas syringae]|uniref:hypothetical protein n=1 Tax=Pseudomonas syringae TaxID=317 RepID=UPI001C819FFF
VRGSDTQTLTMPYVGFQFHCSLPHPVFGGLKATSNGVTPSKPTSYLPLPLACHRLAAVFTLSKGK